METGKCACKRVLDDPINLKKMFNGTKILWTKVSRNQHLEQVLKMLLRMKTFQDNIIPNRWMGRREDNFIFRRQAPRSPGSDPCDCYQRQDLCSTFSCITSRTLNITEDVGSMFISRNELPFPCMPSYTWSPCQMH